VNEVRVKDVVVLPICLWVKESTTTAVKHDILIRSKGGAHLCTTSRLFINGVSNRFALPKSGGLNNRLRRFPSQAISQGIIVVIISVPKFTREMRPFGCV
jgi:hypothetical protein